MPNQMPLPKNDGWPFQLAKVLIWLYLILGITGLGPAIYRGIVNEVENFRNRDFEEVARQNRMLHEKQQELLVAAEKSETNYTPEDYFRDLKTVHELWYKSPEASMTSSEILQMQHCATENVRQGYCSDENIERLSAEFSRWNDQARTQDDFEKMEAQIVAAGGWKVFSRWAWRVYLSSIPFVLLLYWLRLFCDQGVIASILDDKRRFLLAVLLWPVYIWLYPGDRSVRTIIVEAQLRRYGALFRKLSLAERRMVQQARNQSLLLSLRQVRQISRHQPCRLFVIGLLATVICAMAFSACGRETPLTRAGPGVSAADNWCQPLSAGDLYSIVAADLPVIGDESGDVGWDPIKSPVFILVSRYVAPPDGVPKVSSIIMTWTALSMKRGNHEQRTALTCTSCPAGW